MPASTRVARHDAHIVATELRCAVGLTAASAAAAIRAGISRITEHPVFVDANGEKIFCAWDPAIDPATTGLARIARLAELGLWQITETLVAAKVRPAATSVLLAFPEPRPGFDADAAERIARWLPSRLVPTMRSIRVRSVGRGHAGALAALHEAVELVSSGQQEIVIAAGVDSYLDAATLAWLDSHRRLARRDIRSGFPPGEAVALMAVASEQTRARLGLRSLARIGGVECTHESTDPAGCTGLLGEALAAAVLGAVGDPSAGVGPITDVYGDINGELARSHDWGFALIRTATCFRDGSDYVTSAGQCGDVGAATAALGCVLATEAWRRRSAMGPRALVWAGSWGGLRGAAVLDRRAG